MQRGPCPLRLAQRAALVLEMLEAAHGVVAGDALERGALARVESAAAAAARHGLRVRGGRERLEDGHGLARRVEGTLVLAELLQSDARVCDSARASQRP